MKKLKEKLSEMPKGVGVLFFIQIFSTLGFAILYSSLVLYATKKLNFSAKDATTIMGVFGAFNYGLHLFGGYLGGRFLSNRNLFIGGMLLQVLGSGCIAMGTVSMMYFGLGLFLTGSGLNVTCINMMLTQRFTPEDTRRENAFLWNYAGMNLGFFIGFSVAGHYQLLEDYKSLFIFATIGNLISILIAAFYWKTLIDKNTPLSDFPKKKFKLRFLIGTAILIVLVPIVWFLLQHPVSTGLMVKVIAGILALIFIWTTLRHDNVREKNNMWAYLILTLGSLVFWSLYQMAPNGLQFFAVNNVNRKMAFGIEVAPAWIQNINTVVIVIGGPLMAYLFHKLRHKGFKISIPQQFAASLILMGFAFLVLPLGIHFADTTGMVAFSWIFLSYFLQSIGELLISPIGYAMIGKLAPKSYQGVMMGAWMFVTGLASIFAGDFSGMIPEPTEGTAISTNPVYFSLFLKLGVGTLIVGVILTLLIPYLHRLIKDEK